GSSEQVTYHEIDLSSLDPGTTYYYKVLWTDEDGNTGESDEETFETGAAPVVSEVKINNIGLVNAYVTFKVKNAIKANVQYGKTITYGLTESVSTSKSESIYTIQLNALTDGTSYHMRIVAEDDEGNSYNGDDYTFETLPVPKITALKVQQVEGMPTATLRLLWTTNTRLSSVVSYYPVGQPALAKDSINLALTAAHEAVIKDLKEETEYIFLVKGKDIGGNEAKADERKIKTAEDLRPPEIANSQVETSIVGVGDEARAQATITWDTDEPASSQIDYGEGTSGTYSSSTQEDPILTYNHSVTIPGLSPSKIYHFRIGGADKNKNKSFSQDVVIITPNATKDALNLVVDKLSVTFGFLKKNLK
ncbi:fibronectin type III domain-containing protein, partial [Candidatus Woesebacteria bacterium]|nr:fibronectin type III domain-containing protein [Candidatus Woesebacteria bacterium]